MIVVELVHVDKLFVIATKDMQVLIVHEKFDNIKQLKKKLYFS